jgi:hypothetical protein
MDLKNVREVLKMFMHSDTSKEIKMFMHSGTSKKKPSTGMAKPVLAAWI